MIEGAGGFSFNQYLITDDEPLLFHTGPRKMVSLVREAVASVLPVETLRYISFSHVEADECGSLNEWLVVAPQSVPLCGTVAAMVSISDLADRTPRALADGELLPLGKHSVRWFDAPHLPHAWECGFLTENEPLRCYVATCSRKEALIFRPPRSRTFLGRVRLSAMGWITSLTRRTYV
jgi:flavorubredoxin